MARHYYSSISFGSSLSAAITNTQTTITTPESPSDNGWPSNFPFTLALDYGIASQELVDVTSKGTLTGGVRTWNVTRGVDGSTAIAHGTGATVRHPIVGRDLDEAGAHVYASTGVHGITGAVVGDSDSQTLTNKIFPSLSVGTPGVDANVRWYMSPTGAVMFWGGGINTFDVRIDRTNAGELNMFGTGVATTSRWWVGTATQAFQSEVAVRAAVGQQKALTFYSGGTARWVIRSGATAEPGSNAGADLEIAARDDTGGALSNPISIRRSDGQVSLNHSLRLLSSLLGNGLASRYVGTTNGGAPSTGGPFTAGDFVVDLSGGFWICITAGTNVSALWSYVGAPTLSSAPAQPLGATPTWGTTGMASDAGHVHAAPALYRVNTWATRSTPASGAETQVGSFGGVAIVSGRTYRMRLRCVITRSDSQSDLARVRFRLGTTTTGTLLSDEFVQLGASLVGDFFILEMLFTAAATTNIQNAGTGTTNVLSTVATSNTSFCYTLEKNTGTANTATMGMSRAQATIEEIGF